MTKRLFILLSDYFPHPAAMEQLSGRFLSHFCTAVRYEAGCRAQRNKSGKLNRIDVITHYKHLFVVLTVSSFLSMKRPTDCQQSFSVFCNTFDLKPAGGAGPVRTRRSTPVLRRSGWRGCTASRVAGPSSVRRRRRRTSSLWSTSRWMRRRDSKLRPYARSNNFNSLVFSQIK